MEIPKFKKGRKFVNITQKQIDWVLDYKSKFEVGYQRAARALQRRNFKITEYQTRFIFELHDLYLFEKVYVDKRTHSNRYVAKNVNQIWRTDLYYFDKSVDGDKWNYLITFIDDRTRFMLLLDVLDDKSMITSTNH